jgi:hypothetical protein
MFKHATYRLAFTEGGFNGNDNYDLVPPFAMTNPSRNQNLHLGGRQKRGGTDKINAVAITGAPKGLGIGQYIPQSGNSVIITAHADGKIWEDAASAVVTGLSTSAPYDIIQGGAKMFVCNGVNSPQVRASGGTWAAIATPAADWSGSNQPQFMVVHGRGVSRRLYAFGVPGKKDTVYGSASGSFEEFVTGVITFVVDTGDGFGVTGAIEFGEEFFWFGKRTTFIFDDTNSSSANWGHYKAPWQGGVSHQRLLIKTENDVYAMMDDGEIYSVRTAQQTNDYKAASITRPAFIHKWIKQNVDLTAIANFHVEYDPNLKALKWFVQRSGQSTPDTCLVFFLDRPVDQAWAIHDGTDNPGASGYNATASALVRNSDGEYLIYTTDNAGFIWELETSLPEDDGATFKEVMRLPWLSLENVRNEKRAISAELVYVVNGATSISVRWWMDDVEQTPFTETLTTTGSTFPFTFPFTLSTSGINQQPFTLGQLGRRIMFEITNETSKAPLWSQLLIDFEDRGPKSMAKI